MNVVNISDAPYKYPSLRGDMLFRLWKAAILDDDTLADDVMRGMYNGMMVFDRERAEEVMYLLVSRNPTAGEAFHAMLADMLTFRRQTKSLYPSSLARALKPGLRSTLKQRQESFKRGLVSRWAVDLRNISYPPHGVHGLRTRHQWCRSTVFDGAPCSYS